MWRLTPLLLLAACSGAQQPCVLREVTTLPAVLDRNRLLVQGRVDGSNTVMLVDTGSDLTVLMASTVGALQLPRSDESATMLSGVGGDVRNADAFAVISLGPVAARGSFAVADVPGIGGVIGADFLGHFDVEFDLPEQRVRLWEARGCDAPDLPWRGPRQTIRLEVGEQGRLRLPANLDGHAVSAMLDTGAGHSLTTTDFAKRINITDSTLGADPMVMARGIGKTSHIVRMHRFDSLQIGDEMMPGPVLGVGPLPLPDVDMLLGADYLRFHRLWISYRTQKMFVQPATITPVGDQETSSH